MRTQDEILKRLKADESDDDFGVQRTDLVEFLEFNNAKSFLVPTYIKDIESGKEKYTYYKTDEEVIKQIKEYLEFAWDKANNCRGLSAARSLCHFIGWLWLLGYDIDKKFEDYSHYGKPHLREISEKFEFDWKKFDNGEWRNDEESKPLTEDKISRVNLFN